MEQDHHFIITSIGEERRAEIPAKAHGHEEQCELGEELGTATELSPKQRKYLIAWAVFSIIGASFFIIGGALWYWNKPDNYAYVAALGFLFVTLASFCFLEYWRPPGPPWP